MRPRVRPARRLRSCLFGAELAQRVARLRVVVSGVRATQDTAAAEATRRRTRRNEDDDGRGTPSSHQLITFFCFTEVPDYEAELAEHRAFVEENGLEIRGRIYINQQGINAQMSGQGTDGERYARWVESRPHFNGMRVSVYPTHEQAHPKLSLRYKPQLVQLEGGTSHLPVHDPSRRGTPLKPSEWHAMLATSSTKSGDAPRPPRRAQRVRVGRRALPRRGAARAGELPRDRGDERRERWSRRDRRWTGVDKSRPIMMYCTGGAATCTRRCSKSRDGGRGVHAGGGRAGVLREVREPGGPEVGRPAVRVRLAAGDDSCGPTPAADIVPRRYDARVLLRRAARAWHRNCPNVDCNRLFLVCQGCLTARGGFCCAECGKASHVRPTLLQPGRYQRYVHYTEGEAMLRAERRGEGRLARRRRRRERKKREYAAKNAAAVAAGTSKPRDLLRAVRVLEKAAADPEAFAKKGDSGTLAARTRSIAKAAGLLDEPLGDEETGEYATRREKLREAAAMIASGKPPGVDLRAFVESADEALDSSEGKNATENSGA